jgi:hypothetical protein
MPDIGMLRYNASILYNNISINNGIVYVDKDDNFQIDERNIFYRLLSPLGDYSNKTINNLSIKILRKISDAIENNFIDKTQIIKNGDIWIDNRKFGMDMTNSPYFKCWIRIGIDDDNDLFYHELISKKIITLSQMIFYGRDIYLNGKEDYDYGKE